MAKSSKLIDKKYVFHGNEITTAILPYNSKYTANAFCLLVANLVKDKHVYKYKIRTLLELLGITDNNKRTFIEAFDILQSKSIIINEGGSIVKYSLLSYIKYPILTRSENQYIDDSVINELMKQTTLDDKIEIKINSDLVPYLFDLKSEFTSYSLSNFLDLKSVTSKRLYQCLSQWKSKNRVYFSGERLQEILGTQYVRITSLYNKDVKKAMIEISKKTNLTELYATPKKKGRKIIGYTFHFKHIPNQGEIPFLPTGLDMKQIQQFKRLVEDFKQTPSQATRIVKELPILEITKELFRINQMILNNEVKTNLGGYTYKTFRDKFELNFD